MAKSPAELQRDIDEVLAKKKRKVGIGLSAIDEDEWSWSVRHLREGPIDYNAPKKPHEIIANGVEESRGEAVAKIEDALAKLGLTIKDAVSLPF